MKEQVRDIVFVTANMLSRHSADIVYIMEMCNALAKAGYHTTLCVPKPAQSTEALFEYYGVEHPFQVMEIDMPRWFLTGRLPGRSSLFSLAASWRLARTAGLGIYVREPLVFFLTTVLFRRRCIFEAHQFRFGALRTSWYHFLVKGGMGSGLGKMVCISNSLMRQWTASGVDAGKVSVAHDAVNLNKFSGSTSKAAARRALGLDPHLPIVVYTGSLLPGKGVEVLVRCSCRLPEIKFVIVGGNGEEIAPLRRLATMGNVAFIGQVAPDQVPLYQAAADVLALPNVVGSVIDDVTSPMKLFEYMASNRPIVASDMPSLLEVLEHNRNALISPAGDDHLLSENIKSLILDESLSRQLVQNAGRDLKRYTWDHRVESLSNVLSYLP